MIFASLWPVFALLLFGAALKRFNFPGDAFWPLVERLIYYVCFPALLIVRLAAADFSGQLALDLVAAVFALLLVATIFAVLLQRFVRFSGPVFTSFYQGGLRFNTYIALSISAALLPNQGVVYAAIIASVMIPLLNVLCVTIFALFQENRPKPTRVLLNIAGNPLILGCLAGLFLNLTGLGLPWMLSSVLELLAAVALPVGLLAVGAALNLGTFGTAGNPLIASVLFRLILMPLVALVIGLVLQLPQDAFVIFTVFAAVPTASAAYILARQLGGDAPLISGILSAQALLSMLSLPLVLSWVPKFYEDLLPLFA